LAVIELPWKLNAIVYFNKSSLSQMTAFLAQTELSENQFSLLCVFFQVFHLMAGDNLPLYRFIE